MSAKSWRPAFNQRTQTKSNPYGNYLREHAEHDLIPRIIKHQRAALNVVPDLFNFYQRSSTGRRCSCWSAIESSPAAGCLVCFGTGNTGSFEKYGHQTEVFDATAQWSSVNVVVDYNKITRPLHLRLTDQAVKGYVDFNVPVLPSIGKCSLASVYALVSRGSQLAAGIKLFSESDFVGLSTATVAARLATATSQGGMHLRVILRRESLSIESPRLSHVRLRTQRKDDDIIRGDVPRSVESNRGSEYGWFEDFASRTMYIDDTLRVVSTEDFFRQINTNKTWKVTSVNPNAPGGQLTSWDLETRLVQADERFSRVP